MRRTVTRFNAWLLKYVSKHWPAEEGADILNRLSRVRVATLHHPIAMNTL